PNGVYLEEFDPLPPPGEFRAIHLELGNRPYVLFLGRLHPKKGLDYLAEAFTRVIRSGSDAALVVAGPDAGALESFLEQSRRLGIADRVLLTGLIWGRKKLAALVDAACFCLPSRQEGFSMAITEAMACQVPVVISQACHFPEVAQAGAGFVLPLDADAFANALNQLLRDQALRRQMGSAGRELVMTRFNWPTIAEHAVQAYARVLRARPEHAATLVSSANTSGTASQISSGDRPE
ncbi:MAG TPA: glycosyltransferase, partial [Tepidisphaeraceae bacterium]|nr:glycosyltransferase [Tepidisphaeraceae bacterium]